MSTLIKHGRSRTGRCMKELRLMVKGLLAALEMLIKT